MEYTEHYNNMTERNNLCDIAHSNGFRMLHDNFDPDWKRGEEPRGELVFSDVSPTHVQTDPPRSTHISTLVAINASVARPAKVKRIWEGRDYLYDCFVTEAIKDQYVSGDIAVGDFLLVHFDPIGEQIVTDKIFKSW